jgi:GDPmannose 4,6-dehydratase
MERKIALITGVTGQDGSYLAELLLSKGYIVHGLHQLESRLSNIAHLAGGVILHQGNIANSSLFPQLIKKTQPDELYHLAAQTSVVITPEEERGMLEANTISVHRMLEAVRMRRPECRVFVASSAEMFGAVDESPQSEITSMRPKNFYGITKTTSYHFVRHFRQTYSTHASCGILYNHESPRRGHQFVTRKITRAAARIKNGLESELRLGNLDSIRDWGHAADYVRAMWMMLQSPDPDDYVIATGKPRTVREFVTQAFSCAGLDWTRYVIVDPKFYRPLEMSPVIGNATKLRTQLNWSPEISFDDLVREMVDHEIAECIQ